MESGEFAVNCPGTLVSIEDGQAYVPHLLPPDIRIDKDVLRALGSARGALGEFSGESKLVRNDRLITHPLMVKEAVESNKIEGTFTEIENVLMQKISGPPSDPVTASNQREVIHYMNALEMGTRRLEQGWPLSNSLVCALHRELLRSGEGSNHLLGAFRNVQVYIGRRVDGIKAARFVPPPPEQVTPLMENMQQFATAGHYDPLIDCAILHYQFETVHPFEDGNGRMGRLLIPLYLKFHGLLDRPILYLSSFLEAHREEYMDLMKCVSTQCDWKNWIMFFLEAVRDRASESKQRVRKILGLHEKYREIVKTKTNTQASLLAIDMIMESPVVTAPALATYVNTTYPTAKKALQTLEELKIISPITSSYPQAWIARELLNEVYR